MNITIQPVEQQYVQQVWPMVIGFIERAFIEGYPYPKQSLDYSIEHVQGFLSTGQWLLLVAVNKDNQIVGCGTLSFINTPRHRNAIVNTAGGRFITSIDAVTQVKAIAKQHGATKLQAFVRPAMVRLLQKSQYEARNTLMEILL